MLPAGMLFSAVGLLLWTGVAEWLGKTMNGRLSFLLSGMGGKDGRTFSKYWRKYCFWALTLACVLAGWGRMRQVTQEGELESYLLSVEEETGEQKVFATAVGLITSYSESEGYYSLELSDVTVNVGAVEFEEDGILVTAEAETLELVGDLMTGMKLEIAGMLSRHSQARNPGEFDARLYYRGEKMPCRIWAEAVRAETEQRVLPVYQVADAIQRLGKEALEAVCCDADRGIFQAILLGDKGELSEETEEMFQDNGIAHILAVSGLHVSLIGMSCYGILRMLGAGYGTAGMAAAILLFLYGSVTGFGTSVFRAVFMVLCAYLAGWLGRTYDLLSAMALSLLLLAADSPLILCSGGLQLSYGAVLAVGLEQERKKKKGLNGRWGALRMGLMIQLMTLPVVLFHFFRFPVWGILLNLLVIPLLSYAAGSGMAAVGCYMLGKLLGEHLFRLAGLLVGPGHYVFSIYRMLCEWAEQLPFSVFAPGRPELWKIVLYYLVLAGWYWKEFREEDRECYSGREDYPGMVLIILMVFLLGYRPVHGLQVWFLDVGQGDGVVLRTKDAVIVSDCGSSQEKQVGKRRLVPFLESQGIREVDYVLISHSDMDHVNGIQWLLEEEEKITVGTLILPAAGYGKEEYADLMEAAKKRGTEIRYFAEGDGLVSGMLTMDCIHPGTMDSDNSFTAVQNSDPNSHSLVFDVNYGAFSLLLTGDIGIEEEKALSGILEERYEEVGKSLTVLKAAHHGSGGSSAEAFLAAVSPKLAVLSYGAGNSYGHPAPEAVARLEKAGTELWKTAESGAILVHTDGEFYEVRGFLTAADSEG